MQAHRLQVLASAIAALLTACDSNAASAPTPAAGFLENGGDLVQEVRALAAGRGIGPLQAAPVVRPALLELGRALAFDKILSGRKDISCMTCHLPGFATGDGRSLSMGQGATGLGPARVNGPTIPRNAPALFNFDQIRSFFWDGRVEIDARARFVTPAAQRLTAHMADAFEFGALSAQPLFPVLSREEMRAFDGSDLADIKDKQPQQVWKALMDRLGQIPEYRRMFEAAYPGKTFASMNFGHASNAIAAFMMGALSSRNSPWDRFLAGDDQAMSETQLLGARDFLSARCSICHNGPAFTDNQFHNVAVAQLGPGKGDGPGGTDDFGRMRVTGNPAHRYAFRTTPLRNVELTGPYGHDGAFHTLRGFVDHYSESALKLENFDVTQLEPELQGTMLHNLDAILATRDTLLQGVVFPASVIDEVAEFMRALTDPAARDLSSMVPASVPSGLPVDR
jgi:cytochrome c peroxidase